MSARRDRTVPRRALPTAVLALLSVVPVVVAGVVLRSVLADRTEPVVGVGDRIHVATLEIRVDDARRRLDAAAGVGMRPAPMSGPQMPMGSASGKGGGAAMAGMPGMAGMLPEGQERVDVSLLVHNRGDSPHALDPAEFALVSDGEPVPMLADPVSEMTRSTIPAGARMAGTITFVVPEGTTPLRLEHPGADAAVELDTAVPEPPGPAPRHGGGHR